MKYCLIICIVYYELSGLPSSGIMGCNNGGVNVFGGSLLNFLAPKLPLLAQNSILGLCGSFGSRTLLICRLTKFMFSTVGQRCVRWTLARHVTADDMITWSRWLAGGVASWMMANMYIIDCKLCIHMFCLCMCQTILIYQGVHCCTKVCNLHVLRTVRVVIQPESSGWCQTFVHLYYRFTSINCSNLYLLFNRYFIVFSCQFILIYQGVHCCTKVCNLHLDVILSSQVVSLPLPSP